jgi:hypothetical protein
VARAHREVDDPVTVQIAEGLHARAELVAVQQRPRESSRGVADLLAGLHGPAGLEEQDPDRAPVRAAVVVEQGSDREVEHAVAIEVTETRDADAEGIAVVQDAREAAG